MRTRPLHLAALLVAVAIAGCGEPTVNVDKASKFIAAGIEKQLGADVGSVDCPDSVTAKAGGSFKCVAIGADGTRGEVDVTQRDDKGYIDFHAPFLDKVDTEQTLERAMSRGARTPEVSCPDIVVVKFGSRFECESTTGTQTSRVSVRQPHGAVGNFRYDVMPR